jgi:ferredoxin
MLASSGYVCRSDIALCIECGACAELCQFGAITTSDGPAVVDAALCMGCGVCVDQCPQGALVLARDPERSAPLELDHLMAAAATEAETH